MLRPPCEKDFKLRQGVTIGEIRRLYWGMRKNEQRNIIGQRILDDHLKTYSVVILRNSVGEVFVKYARPMHESNV